jgi:alpha-galactosidase
MEFSEVGKELTCRVGESLAGRAAFAQFASARQMTFLAESGYAAVETERSPCACEQEIPTRSLINPGGRTDGMLSPVQALAVCFVLLTGPLLQAAESGTYVRTSTDRAAWSIGNALVERTIGFDEQHGLRTLNWRHKLTSTDFAQRAGSSQSWGEEFSFRAGEEKLDGRSGFTFVSADPVDLPNGKALRIRLHHKDGKVEIAVMYAVYDNQPAVRKWVEVTNRTSQAVTLTQLCFEAVKAAPGAPSELQLWAGYGDVPRELFFTGRASDTALVSRSARTGEGLVVLNEAPGYLKRTEMGADGWNDMIRVMYDTDLFPFARTLAPGETFTSAKSSILFFQDDRGLADRHWVVPGYTSEVIWRRGRSYQPPWLFNTWEPFQRGINETISTDLIQAAGKMGIDIFTIDDGWQAEYGDNGVDGKNFPGGLEKIRGSLAEKHMALGLWVPLAAISTAAQDYKQHPEWVCRDRQGKPKFTNTMAGMQAVMCLGSAYREAAAKRLLDLIEKEHPKYLKVDLTTVFNAYGEDPGCDAPGHDHRSWAESLTRIYEGLQYVGERLYREHPEVLVDYTFELWGEKHLIDPALLGVADLDWLSNIEDATPESAGTRQARMLLYHRSLAIPVEAMLIGNLHAATPPIEERFGAAIGSGPLLVGDLRKLSPAQLDWYAQKIGWFKQLRRRASLNDSFFPLGDWQQVGTTTWDGFARLSRTGDGMVVIFRNQSSVRSALVRLPAPPAARYEVRSITTGRVLGPVSAAALQAGWNVPLVSNLRTEVFELVRQNRE